MKNLKFVLYNWIMLYSLKNDRIKIGIKFGLFFMNFVCLFGFFFVVECMCVYKVEVDV